MKIYNRLICNIQYNYYFIILLTTVYSKMNIYLTIKFTRQISVDAN